jgi:tetratricopeptide (TPR) repeat protein
MRFAVFGLAAVLACSATPAFSQVADSWIACSGVDQNLDIQIAGCTAVIESDEPSSMRARAYLNRAAAHFERNDLQRALTDYDESIRLDARVSMAFVERGVVHMRLRDYDSARADYDEAVRLDPSNGRAFNNRGVLATALRQYDIAIPDLDRANMLEPGNAVILSAMCWARARANVELQVAREACDESLRLSPNRALTREARGLVGLLQAQNDEAWRHYDLAVQLEPNNPDFLYGRGVSALRLGRVAEGRADIAAAVALEPDVEDRFREFGVAP